MTRCHIDTTRRTSPMYPGTTWSHALSILMIGAGVCVCVNAAPQDAADPSQEDSGSRMIIHDEFPDATFSGASRSVNRQGKPQKWQTAVDSDLPGDFAEGDTLIDVWAAEPGTLTPFVSRDAYATRVYREILESLIWDDVDSLRPVPGLARSWEVSEDGLTLTFHLFENACFSDGHPVTSDDVIFTFDLINNDKIDAPVTRSYVADNIASWTALDKHTVQFKMKEKYFLALDICGGQWILPKHIYGDVAPEVYNEQMRETCIGSGPWILKQWDKGEQIVLERNENYWGPKPAMKEHVFRIISNGLTRWQDFKAGKVDIIGPTAEQWAEYKDSPELAERGSSMYYFSPLGGYLYIGYNLRKPMLSNKLTRQALTMLIDRQDVIDTLREGIGEIVTGPFYFQSDQYNKEVEPWPYDPDWAAEKLNEAGWSDSDGDGVLDQDFDGDGVGEPFKLTFLMPSGGGFGPRFQRYVADQFKQAGIEVLLDTLDWSVFEQRLTERDFEMVCLAWTGSPESDPYQIWHSSQAENRGSNYVGFKNERCDELIEAARRELDYDKRMAMWHEVHAILHEEQPYTFVFNRPSMSFIDKRFENVLMHPLRLYISEWYVPEDQQVR